MPKEVRHLMCLGILTKGDRQGVEDSALSAYNQTVKSFASYRMQ